MSPRRLGRPEPRTPAEQWPKPFTIPDVVAHLTAGPPVDDHAYEQACIRAREVLTLVSKHRDRESAFVLADVALGLAKQRAIDLLERVALLLDRPWHPSNDAWMHVAEARVLIIRAVPRIRLANGVPSWDVPKLNQAEEILDRIEHANPKE